MEEKSIVAYDAWDEFYKTPFGAVKAGEEIRVRIRVLREANPSGAVLKLRRDGESAERTVELLPDKEQDSTYTGAFSVEETGLWFYRFEISVPEGLLFVGQGEDAKAKVEDFLPEWQLTVYDPAFSVPEWLKGGILYQIFPDRFFKSRSGELPPVRNERTLHANWQERPVFEAASNHRYNTGDYLAVDPWLGEEGDLIRLFDEARKMGVRVILDGVFSHTGSDSRYFNKDGHYDSLGAWQSPESPYAAWYRFKDKERKEYDCWWGIPTLPNVNEEEPSFEKFICGEGGVLDYWIERGAGGWRLDVADELPDGFLDQVRRRLKGRSSELYLLGEVWEDASDKVSYGERRRYLLGGQLDGVMNYCWREALLEFIKAGDASLFKRRILTICDHYPAPALEAVMNPLSTHDVARAATVLGVLRDVPEEEQGDFVPLPEERERGRLGLKLAVLLQYVLPGIPSIYYGDEAGLFGFSDPWNRRCYPWGEEDEELIGFFKKLGSIRRENEKVFSEPLRFLKAEDGFVLVSRGRLLAAVNRGKAAQGVEGTLLLSVGEISGEGTEWELSPGSGGIFWKK